MNFTDSLKENSLGEMLEKEFGRWGHFSVEAADLVIEVSKMEKISPELLGYTWMKESCGNFYPMPNTNGKPECVLSWDLGPMQINMGWAFKSIWVKEYKADDLHYDQVFGSGFYDIYLKPCAFTGDPKIKSKDGSKKIKRS